ncbi:hypothetical protein [Streptosporangium sp. NPDC001681]|uniref:hypothetical protein n=1 Tax=Streptosporangium sp. NPDC001681 TaxID=3154395 RepID=UPI0033226885
MSTRADADAARAAQQVQKYAPTWLVIWSLRHRRFEAWQCTDPARCHIVHATSAAELWDLMEQAELDLWRTPPPAPTPPAPGTASHPDPPLSAAPLVLPPGHPGRALGPHPSPPEGSQP